MQSPARRDLVEDLFLPTLLFVALGGMTWAVRGCSGFGASVGCIFAGVTWGAAWWFIARNPNGEPTRRYASGWIVLAVTVGMGIAGARGWMQWPSFFEGKMVTNAAAGESVPISRAYGFLWLFIAGVPWAGVSACLLAWCGSQRTTRVWHWVIRLACGIGGAYLARYLFDAYPQYFLPMYDEFADRYRDLEQNPTLRRLINDCGSALFHVGLYLGLLLFELARRDWKNVVLILTVGIVNGAGWAACQNWKWAPDVWPGASFNWWRCWESSGGLSIGVALGLAYFLVNGRMSPAEQAIVRSRRSITGPNLEWLAVYLLLTAWFGFLLLSAGRLWGQLYFGTAVVFGIAYYLLRRNAYAREPEPDTEAYGDPNLERWGLYVGLLYGLGISLRAGLKGWFNIYYGNEDYYSAQLWRIFGPCFLAILIAICACTLFWPRPRNFRGNLFPRAGWLMALVLVQQNVIAQLITGPLDQWNEAAFSIYYVLLFAITVPIVLYYTLRQRLLAE
ncbi:MAG TPA: hypothetical protein VGN12_16215 [Pirellulales bacterium]|jgi:hypothetical protein